VFYFYKSVLPGAQTNGAVEVFIKPGSHTHVLDSVLQITDEPVHSSLQSHDESRGFSGNEEYRSINGIISNIICSLFNK